MKKFLTVLLCAIVSAACVFAFVGCGSGEDYSDDISQLQRQISDLRAQLDAEKQKVTALEQSFTGSPKFNYSGIGEAIPYYINGTKVFDFIITQCQYNNTTHMMAIYYSASFSQNLTQKNKDVFSAQIFSGSILVDASYIYDDAISMSCNSNEPQSIVLYYLNFPFACVTVTPTLVN